MKKNRQAELISQITDKQLLNSLYLTQFALLTISLILGIFLFEDFSSFFSLFQWSPAEILLYGIGGGLLVVFIDLCLMKWLPDSYYDDGEINSRLFAGLSVAQVFFVAALVAISEEVLFRGVIQTSFGILAASIIFAIVHVRYFGHWFLAVNVILLSFWIGFVYEWTGNLAVTIAMHTIIDFLLGLVIRHQAKTKSITVKEGIDDDSGPLP